jgi:hypothetical protein
VAGGLDAGKYFWRSGREKCFSLDIPFYRTSGPYFPHHLQISRTHVTKSCVACRNKQSVLVDNVESMQMPERPIPAFVWLDRPDRIFSFWPRTLDFSLNGVFELKCALRDWK